MKKEQLERMRRKLGEIEPIIREDVEGAATVITSFDNFKAAITAELKNVLWAEYEGQNKPPETP